MHGADPDLDQRVKARRIWIGKVEIEGVTELLPEPRGDGIEFALRIEDHDRTAPGQQSWDHEPGCFAASACADDHLMLVAVIGEQPAIGQFAEDRSAWFAAQETGALDIGDGCPNLSAEASGALAGQAG